MYCQRDKGYQVANTQKQKKKFMKTKTGISQKSKVEILAWLTIGIVIAVLAYMFSGASVYASV